MLDMWYAGGSMVNRRIGLYHYTHVLSNDNMDCDSIEFSMLCDSSKAY